MKPLSEISVKFIAITLIVAVGIHSLNSFFYTHSHQLEDGTIITHAHPFDTSSDTDPFKSHEHTATEITFLATLVYFLPTAGLCTLFVSVLEVGATQLHHNFLLGQLASFTTHLRGPPVS